MFTIAFIAWGFIGIAQTNTITEQAKDILHPTNYASITNTEVYRVDSVYCYSGNIETGEETPNVRQYNTAFSETGQILSQIEQVYNNGVYFNSVSRNYSYDENDFLLEQTDQNWSATTQSWTNAAKTIYTLDVASSEYAEIVSQVWDLGSWKNTVRTVNMYNDAGIIVQSDGYLWENGAWVQDYANYFSVNINTGLTVATLFQKRNEDGQLVNLNRTFLTYDSNENLIEISRDVFQGGWIASSRTLYTFENDLQVEESYQVWNQGTETWQNQTLVETIYTFFDKPFQVTTSSWNGTEYVFYSKTTNSYDEYENLTEFSSDFFYQNEWRYVGRCQFFWSLYSVSSVEEINRGFDILKNCKIANPTVNGSCFSCKDWTIEGKGEIEIFNLDGKKVYSETVGNQEDIRLDMNSDDGLYIIVLKDDRGLVWRKKIFVKN